MPIPKFIRVENDTVYFNQDGVFMFFVPESFFDKGCAVIDGEYVELIGILNYSIKKDFNDTDYSKDLKTFRWDSRFITKPGSIEKVKNLQLSPYGEPTDYRIFKYTNNYSDQIIVSTKVPEEIVNVEDIFRLFVLTGNIPNTISYDDIHNVYMDSIFANGSSYNLSAQVIGLIAAVQCRDPKDLSKPFRLSKSTSMFDYVSLPITKIPKYNGAYISLTSENWDDSLIGAIMNPDAKDTPLEKVVMGF